MSPKKEISLRKQKQKQKISEIEDADVAAIKTELDKKRNEDGLTDTEDDRVKEGDR